MPKWTEQQRDAIADRGHSLIVCAAAGSGKTAVLVERIVQLVREGCPIENMLVVTFTNAAAGEMRQRIGEALGKAAREDPALGEQVMALSRASISTLHRFCGNLLREHFQALSIDPGFRIGDEQECGVLSHQAMEDAIYSCYEVGSDAFLAADRCYTQEELSELAFALHRFMMTRPDPWAFLARAQETVCLTGEAFEQSPAARLLADFAGRRLERLCANARETLALCEGENGPLHYAAACGMDVQLTADLAAAAADGYAALHDALHGVTFAALGRKKKTDLFDEDIADRVKARRDALKKAVADVQTAFALTLEDAAREVFLDFEEEIFNRRRGEWAALEGLGVCGKLAGNAARLATILCAWADEKIISAARMRDAVMLARWFAEHMLRLYGEQNTVNRQAQEVLTLLQKRGEGCVLERVLTDTLRKRQGFDKDAFERALCELEARGYIQRDEVKGGGRPVKYIYLHPELMQERGEIL